MASKCIYPNRSINSYLAESSSQIIELSTVRTPIVDPFPIEDPSLKIQIEDPFLFSKKWVLGVLY